MSSLQTESRNPAPLRERRVENRATIARSDGYDSFPIKSTHAFGIMPKYTTNR